MSFSHHIVSQIVVSRNSKSAFISILYVLYIFFSLSELNSTKALFQLKNVLIIKCKRKPETYICLLLLARGCQWNSQHVYGDFTIDGDQSESWTHACHVGKTFCVIGQWTLKESQDTDILCVSGLKGCQDAIIVLMDTEPITGQIAGYSGQT